MALNRLSIKAAIKLARKRVSVVKAADGWRVEAAMPVDADEYGFVKQYVTKIRTIIHRREVERRYLVTVALMLLGLPKPAALKGSRHSLSISWREAVRKAFETYKLTN